MNNDFPQQILLIEDEEDHAELIGRAFDDVHLTRPQLARTLQEAREMIASNLPDLVIVDLTLPDGKGTELLFPIKEEGPFPIIIMSSRGDEAIAVEAMKHGALDYLVKSNDMLSTMPKLIDRAFREWQLILDRKHIVDALHRSEQQLRQAKKMEALGTLAGGIAHDFNNILTSILGYTQLAIEKAHSGRALEHDLYQIQQAGDRAKHLVKQILAFSRHSTGQMKPNSLRDIIEEALELLRPTLPSTIELQTNFCTLNDLVLSDSTQIHQVLINLCTNSATSMLKGGGRLGITLQETSVNQHFANQHPPLQPGIHVSLTISDTGQGIAPDILDRIFDPFFTTKKVGQGTGLGLSVVHGIISQHQGAITVKSQPNNGTTFTIFLPQLNAQERLQLVNPSMDASLQGTGHILFVDDEKQLVELGKESLEANGYEVSTHTNSIHALEDFRANPDQYDAIVTDQTMPHMTGEDFVRETLCIRPDIPIILLTGFSDTITSEQAKELGITFFLMKPILPRELSRVLKEALASSRKNQSGDAGYARQDLP